MAAIISEKENFINYSKPVFIQRVNKIKQDKKSKVRTVFFISIS